MLHKYSLTFSFIFSLRETFPFIIICYNLGGIYSAITILWNIIRSEKCYIYKEIDEKSSTQKSLKQKSSTQKYLVGHKHLYTRFKHA